MTGTNASDDDKMMTMMGSCERSTTVRMPQSEVPDCVEIVDEHYSSSQEMPSFVEDDSITTTPVGGIVEIVSSSSSLKHAQETNDYDNLRFEAEDRMDHHHDADADADADGACGREKSNSHRAPAPATAPTPTPTPVALPSRELKDRGGEEGRGGGGGGGGGGNKGNRITGRYETKRYFKRALLLWIALVAFSLTARGRGLFVAVVSPPDAEEFRRAWQDLLSNHHHQQQYRAAMMYLHDQWTRLHNMTMTTSLLVGGGTAFSIPYDAAYGLQRRQRPAYPILQELIRRRRHRRTNNRRRHSSVVAAADPQREPLAGSTKGAAVGVEGGGEGKGEGSIEQEGDEDEESTSSHEQHDERYDDDDDESTTDDLMPVVLIPGFVTSALELWQGEACAQKYFRQRLWGGVGPSRSFFTDRECWRRHLALDVRTGMDPRNIRLRAGQGFHAADYFLSGYWVWNKIIQNLADLGYDPSTMTMETYDWRLAFPLLEERDGYFTKLKHRIESTRKSSRGGRKVALVSHSMGSLLVHYFFAWVATPESEGGGGGGEDWVETNVDTFVNIAGPLLGVPKAVPSLLSGEFKDTCAWMGGTFGSMMEQLWGRNYRKSLWNTWGSLWTMIPTGGNAIWGTGADLCHHHHRHSHAHDDDDHHHIDNSTTTTMILGDGFRCLNKADANDEMTTAITTTSSWAPFLEFTDSDELSRNNNNNKEEQEEKKIIVDDDNDDDDSTFATGSQQQAEAEVEEDGDGDDDDDDDDDKGLEHLVSEFAKQRQHSLESTVSFLTSWGAGYGSSLSSTRVLSFEPPSSPPPPPGPRDGTSNWRKSRKEREKPTKTTSSSREWHDVTKTPLPFAPSLKIYCLYGVGIDTERAFFYKRNTQGSSSTTTSEAAATATTTGSTTQGGTTGSGAGTTSSSSSSSSSSPVENVPFVMDGDMEDAEQKISYGAKLSDGDASVPLLSLGYMCVEGWNKKKRNGHAGNNDHDSGGGGVVDLNPSNIRIVTREYANQERSPNDFSDPMRGGPHSADHVDILGNVDMMDDLLRILTNLDPPRDDRIVSDIETIASEIRRRPSERRPTEPAPAQRRRSRAKKKGRSTRSGRDGSYHVTSETPPAGTASPTQHHRNPLHVVADFLGRHLK